MATAAELERQWADKYRILRGISRSIVTERQRGNEAGVQALLPHFKRVADEMRSLSSQIEGADLTAIEQFILRVERGVTTLVQLPAQTLKTALTPLLGPFPPLVLVLGAVGLWLFLSGRGGARRDW